ncbi:cysteine rich repeat-containing protein [Rhizobium sp. 2YAF20]|uniref:cysteine rich repeat-containing protein n=1 Tax=Rhizobium sp. 2YAF20 TaxID=3233027 RepID=UPI003F952FBF
MPIRRRLLWASTMTAFLALGVVAHAETISYADAVTSLAKDCGADIKKLCSGLNLGNGQIADCLQKNSAKVSPTCTSTLGTVTASIKQRQAKQVAYYEISKRNMATTCKGVKGDGNMLSCLVKSNRIVSGPCNQAITDAGWR